MQVALQGVVQKKIIEIRNNKVLIDSDVAELYGIETREVNQAVKNNTEKFPDGYLIELDANEKKELIKNFDRFKNLKHATAPIKGFTERGLYMLATILKSPKAVETTIAIIDTFAKVKELGRIIHQMQTLPENSPKQRTLMEHTGDLMADLIIQEDDMEVTGTETSYEMNFAIFKIKRTVKKSKHK
jgi:phage regulator Rha-like protein